MGVAVTHSVGMIRFRRLAALLALLALAALALAARGVGTSEAAGVRSACANAHAEPGTLTVPDARKAILCLINERRAGAGVRALGSDGRLDKAANRHNARMVGSGCFDHVCSGERDMTSRIRSSGYLNGAGAWFIGENIAWGEGSLGTPAAIVQAWMDSPTHRANILNRRYDDIGIAVSGGTPRQADKADGATFTTDFGHTSG